MIINIRFLNFFQKIAPFSQISAFYQPQPLGLFGEGLMNKIFPRKLVESRNKQISPLYKTELPQEFCFIR